jgi:uncharacterized protein
LGAGGRGFESHRPDQFRFVIAEQIIEKLRLERHPEGGWFTRTYKSEIKFHSGQGERFAVSHIYYLLAQGEHSALHFLASDETWFYHAGCGMIMHLFGESGYEKKLLGANLHHGEQPQVTITAQTTFGAELPNRSEWCLIGCSVCPGFDFDDFSWANCKELSGQFPEQVDLINRLKSR